MQAQRKLILPGETPTLVLSTVEAARQALPGHDEDDITALIEDGSLLYAWNIGLGTSREIRIFPASIEHYRVVSGRCIHHHPTDEEVFAALVPDKPFVPGSWLRLVLACSSTHITNLLEAKAISVVPNTTWGTGRNGTALITTASWRQFLTDRRLP